MKTKHIISSNARGKHRIVYQDWGDENNPRVLLCVHGLTRNSRDFDYIADHLSSQYRVIAPDIVGRGQSDWLADSSLYTLEQYINDMGSLLKALNIGEVDWLGTSLGGLIGMAIASAPHSPIKHLILNDIGPVIKKEAIAYLATSLAETPHFNSLDELKGFLKEAYSAMGHLDHGFWEHMATYDHRITPEGRLTRNFDPKITHWVGSMTSADLAMWDLWENIQCPTLVLHGELSIILTPEICKEMLARNSHATVVTLPKVGHTPSLMTEAQIAVVENWLKTTAERPKQRERS
jgi:pimeloyl-ACP methyl ester carboxylesterase